MKIGQIIIVILNSKNSLTVRELSNITGRSSENIRASLKRMLKNKDVEITGKKNHSNLWKITSKGKIRVKKIVLTCNNPIKDFGRTCKLCGIPEINEEFIIKNGLLICNKCKNNKI